MVIIWALKSMGLIRQSCVAVAVVHPHYYHCGKPHEVCKLQGGESYRVALKKTLAQIGVEPFFSSVLQEVGQCSSEQSVEVAHVFQEANAIQLRDLLSALLDHAPIDG